jgi:hypothetical protein
LEQRNFATHPKALQEKISTKTKKIFFHNLLAYLEVRLLYLKMFVIKQTNRATNIATAAI